MRFILLGVAVYAFVCGSTVSAQTTLNPDVSVVGDFHAHMHDDPGRPNESKKLNFGDPEAELLVAGYLNPYARANLTASWVAGGEAEVEEIYAEFVRGIPLGLTVKAGKYLQPFGRLNLTHAHAYPFIERPLPHEVFFGDEGLNDIGVQVSALLPTGSAYTEAMAAALKGDGLYGPEVAVEDADGNPLRPNTGFLGRLTTSLAVSEYGELALGATALNEVYEIDSAGSHQLRAWLVGGDFKYKHKPSRYNGVQTEGELIVRSEELAGGGHLTSYGGYAYADFRFHQRYNAGPIGEFVRIRSIDDFGGEPVRIWHDTWRAGLFVGFAPVEETSVLRLVGRWTEPDEGDGFWETTLQLVFSLGPHQPHNF